MRPIVFALFAALAAVAANCPLHGASAQCPDPVNAPGETIPTPPPMTPIEQHIVKGIADRTAAQQFATIGFGDSNMFGWPQPMLTEALGAPALNASVGGGTQTMLWELQTIDWSRQSPSVVVALVGANNLGDTVCNVYWGIRADVSAARAVSQGADRRGQHGAAGPQSSERGRQESGA